MRLPEWVQRATLPPTRRGWDFTKTLPRSIGCYTCVVHISPAWVIIFMCMKYILRKVFVTPNQHLLEKTHNDVSVLEWPKQVQDGPKHSHKFPLLGAGYLWIVPATILWLLFFDVFYKFHVETWCYSMKVKMQMLQWNPLAENSDNSPRMVSSEFESLVRTLA